MFYNTTEELVLKLINRKDVKVDELTYLEETIESRILSKIVKRITNWTFDKMINTTSKVCIVGDENNAKEKLVIVLYQSTNVNYYDDFISDFLSGNIITYDEMCEKLIKNNIYASCIIDENQKQSYSQMFQFNDFGQILKESEDEIKVIFPNRIEYFHKSNIDFIRNIENIYPTKLFNVENCMEIFQKNGNKKLLYYSYC